MSKADLFLPTMCKLKNSFSPLLEIWANPRWPSWRLVSSSSTTRQLSSFLSPSISSTSLLSSASVATPETTLLPRRLSTKISLSSSWKTHSASLNSVSSRILFFGKFLPKLTRTMTDLFLSKSISIGSKDFWLWKNISVMSSTLPRMMMISTKKTPSKKFSHLLIPSPKTAISCFLTMDWHIKWEKEFWAYWFLLMLTKTSYSTSRKSITLSSLFWRKMSMS